MSARSLAAIVAIAMLPALLPALLPAQRGGAGGSHELVTCRARNRNLLSPVETRYASARIHRADQEQYTSLIAPIRNVGSTLADCEANTARIRSLTTTVDGMVARALANPIRRVGDRAQGGVVVQTDADGWRGLVSADADVGALMWYGAARQACDNLVQGGQSDWRLPTTSEIKEVWQQRAIVGNFKAEGQGHYWTGTPVSPNGSRMYWFGWSDQSSGSLETQRTGVPSPQLNARCVRSFRQV